MNELANEIIAENFHEVLASLSSLQYQIIRILETKGPMTRNEIVKELKSPRTTIYDNLARLQRLNILQKFNRNNGMIGRPVVYWQIA